jgi:hypothetical protein
MSTPDNKSRQRSTELSSNNNSRVGKLEIRREEGLPLQVSVRMTCPKCGVSSIGGLRITSGNTGGSKTLGILNGVAFVALGSWMIYSLAKVKS